MASLEVTSYNTVIIRDQVQHYHLSDYYVQCTIVVLVKVIDRTIINKNSNKHHYVHRPKIGGEERFL
jgi:hypothetical protein